MPITRPESEVESHQHWRDYTDRTPLRFRWSHSPTRTIELDLDSLHRTGSHYEWGFIDFPLGKYATKNEDLTATIYVYETFSSNFMPACNSVFFGVIGKKEKEILEVMESTFRALQGVRVRASESMQFEEYQRVRHIEGGRLWAPYEAGVWCSEERRAEKDGDDEVTQEAPTSGDGDGNQGRWRRRRVRGDVRVGNVITSIENQFGLPVGSVVFVDPRGSRVRVDIRISTLRRRWDEE